MSLNDFEILDNIENTKKQNSKKSKNFIDEIELKDIEYYLVHMDELINNVKKSYYAYINAKLKYDFKKNEYQATMDWSKENSLRELEGLPKITAQPQRDAVIEMKLKNVHINMKIFELEYKMYSKIFDFINKNYGLITDKNCCVGKFDEDWKNKLLENDINELLDI